MKIEIPPHLWHIERNLDMTHGSQVVNFIRLHVRNDGNKIGCIAQVAIMKKKLDAGLVAVAVDVINTASVEGRRTTDDAMNLSDNGEISEQTCCCNKAR